MSRIGPTNSPSSSAHEGQRAYWDANLDPQNLSRADGPAPDLDEEIAFLSSPEYLRARERMGAVEGARVLEIGCGLGVNALALARCGARVIALDLSRERLRALRDWAACEGLADRILAVQGAIEAAPLRDGAADRAFTKSVLIHTRIELAAAEIARVLRPQGLGVFIEPARFNPFALLYRRCFAPRVWREIATYFDTARWARFAAPFAKRGTGVPTVEKSIRTGVPTVDHRTASSNRQAGRLSCVFEREPFFLCGFLAFYWQFARRDLGRFRRALRFWGRIDAALFRLCPPLRALRWMDVVTVVRAPETASPRADCAPRARCGD